MNIVCRTLLGLTVCVSAPFAFAQDPAAEAAPPEPTTEKAYSEDEALQILQGESDWAAKQDACRALRRVATDKSIPVLVGLLSDPELAQYARYALEPLPSDAAGQALRDALGTTEGAQKAGVIISLGAREDEQSVPLLLPLLGDADGEVARAAAGALGRIGTAEAADALMAALPGASEEMKPVLAEAVLAAAERLVEEKSAGKAVAIYEAMLAPEQAEYLRLGAFRGIIEAQPSRSTERLIAALEKGDPVFRDLAAQIIAETSGAADTRQFANASLRFKGEGKAAMIRGLGGRGDSGALQAVTRALEDESPEVRLAAIEALAKLGDSTHVALLATMLASEDESLSTAATAGLRGMQKDGVDAAIAAAFPDATPAVKARLLNVLTDRFAMEGLVIAAANTGDVDADVRAAALRALMEMGSVPEIAVAVAAMNATEEADERRAAQRALDAIAAREKDEAVPAIVEALNAAPGEQKGVFFRALRQTGTAAGLDTVVAHINEGDDPAVAEEAVDVLGGWPTADAAPHLLALAKSEDPKRKETGFKGYVRIARDIGDVEQKSAMLREATALAKERDQKWLVLSAWGTVATGESMDTLLPYLDDAEVKSEAGSAVISVANQIATHSDGAKEIAKNSLKQVIEKVENEQVKARAQESLDKLG